jgi:hypothetical protein
MKNMETSKIFKLVTFGDGHLVAPKKDYSASICKWNLEETGIMVKGAEDKVAAWACDPASEDIWGASLDESILRWDSISGRMVRVIKNVKNERAEKLKDTLFDYMNQLVILLYRTSITIYSLTGEIRANFKLDKEINCGAVITKATGLSGNTLDGGTCFLICALNNDNDLVVIDLARLTRCRNVTLGITVKLNIAKIHAAEGNAVLLTTSGVFYRVTLANGKIETLYDNGNGNKILMCQVGGAQRSYIVDQDPTSGEAWNIRMKLAGKLFKKKKVVRIQRIDMRQDVVKEVRVSKLSGSGELYAYVGGDGGVRVYNAGKRKLLKKSRLQGHAYVSCATAIENNCLLISTSEYNKFDHGTLCYNAITGTTVTERPFHGHSHRIIAHYVVDELNAMVTISEDARIINTHLIDC